PVDKGHFACGCLVGFLGFNRRFSPYFENRRFGVGKKEPKQVDVADVPELLTPSHPCCQL
ncbi:hypothetical protein M9458_052148, partial [Cirrhinus mrigala]